MWDRCWSTAIVRFGLPAREFWKLTPRQLHVLTKCDRERIEQQQEHQELLAGIVAACVVNHSFSPPRSAKAPADFMPSLLAKKEKMSDRDRVAEQMRSFFSAKLARQNAREKK